MFGNKTLERLNEMLDEAIAGTFQESDYDETELSRTEVKWKQFLGSSVLSRENLEREKDSIKELVSDISHQTKTPMANIKLYAALLRENLEIEAKMAEGEAADGEACRKRAQYNQNLVTEIVRQTEKLEFLIQALTKMSRLETNIVTVEPKRQSIGTLIEAAVGDIQSAAEKKGVAVTVKGYHRDMDAYYDLKWTKEALVNVLDNAVKYSPKGSQVTVSATEYEIYTAISVKDTGIGISESDMAKIFGRFYRSGEVQQEEGVGIGLYLTREILKKEYGYIKVKSQPQKGSEFLLYLLRDEV